MFGWFSDASASASRRKRLTRSASRENSSGKIFIATSRFNFVSRARYTWPIPPLPSRAVISSEPSRVPTSTDIGISLKCKLPCADYARSDRGSKLDGTEGDELIYVIVDAMYAKAPPVILLQHATHIYPAWHSSCRR